MVFFLRNKASRPNILQNKATGESIKKNRMPRKIGLVNLPIKLPTLCQDLLKKLNLSGRKIAIDKITTEKNRKKNARAYESLVINK